MVVSPPQVELLIRRAGQPERRLLLGPGTKHVGRAEDNDLVLADVDISRRHARIVIDGSGVTIEDMGSGNGVWFRGQRVRRQVVEDGDEVVLDPFTLRFRVLVPETTDSVLSPTLPIEDDTDHLARDDGPTTRRAASPPPGARIVTLSGQRLADRYAMRGRQLTLGRAEGLDVVLFDPAASRDHCAIVARGRVYWLVDHGSANGTFVNTKRVRECPLEAGDRIRIGATEFRFEQGQPPQRPRTQHPGQSTTPMAIPLRPADLPPRRKPRGADPRRSPDPADRHRRDHAPDPRRHTPPPSSAPQATPAAQRREKPARTRPLPAGDTVPLPGARLARIAAQLMVLAVVSGLLLVVGGGVFLVSNRDRVSRMLSTAGWTAATPRAAAVTRPPPPPSDPALEPRTAPLFDEGEEAFEQARYLDAAAMYYKVLQVDPAHLQAERMGYVACEHIALDTMRDALLRRTVPPAEQQQRYDRALAMADDAIAGTSDLGEARSALDDALAFFPGDPSATTALDLVLAQESIKRDADKARAHKRRIEKLYKLARLDAERGNLADAIGAYEAVMAADPEKITHYFYDARDGIEDTKSAMAELAKPELAAAEAAALTGDLDTARQKYARALELDPYSAAARAGLGQSAGATPSGDKGD